NPWWFSSRPRLARPLRERGTLGTDMWCRRSAWSVSARRDDVTGGANVRRWDGLEGVPAEWGRSVVAIGVFDGVHRGHRAIVETAAEHGRDLGLPAVVVTFDPHPQAVLRGTVPPVLTSVDRRVEILGEYGADAVVVLPFTKELSVLSAEEFVQRVLVDRLRASAVVVGEDFRFGHRATGDLGTLATLGEKYD